MSSHNETLNVPKELSHASPNLTRRNFLGGALLTTAALYSFPVDAIARNMSHESQPQVVLPPTTFDVSKLYNLPSFSTDDIDAILWGEADGVVLWAPDWSDEESERGQVDDAYWKVFDAQLAATEGIKNRYIVTSCSYPKWAYRNKNYSEGLEDTGPNSPFSHFQRRVAEHSPKDILGIASLNEPNKYFEGYEDREKQTAELTISSDIAYHEVGLKGLHIILNSADIDKSGDRGYYFNENVISRISNSKHVFRCHTVLGHHYYEDCHNGTTYGVELQSLLAQTIPGTLGMLALLEGGYKYQTVKINQDEYGYADGLGSQEQQQLDNFLKIWGFVNNNVDNVVAMANYMRTDSRRGKFTSGTIRYGGKPHLLGKVFAQL
jgi:hypothetical protein